MKYIEYEVVNKGYSRNVYYDINQTGDSFSASRDSYTQYSITAYKVGSKFVAWTVNFVPDSRDFTALDPHYGFCMYMNSQKIPLDNYIIDNGCLIVREN